MDIRNVAIIAHVDHGKTTLVDALLKAGGVFAAHQQVQTRVMDSDAQERERGITIYAKNAAVTYKDTKINIVDTPGHADFGSEVERVLGMVDATMLLVDAYEGPMPQTRFVLGKALGLGLKVLVVINKIDKPMARPDEVLDLTFDLFSQLNATDEQMDFPYIYTIAKQGVAIRDLKDEHGDIAPLLDWLLEHVPPAGQDTEKPFRMQPATLAYDNYLGRLAVGRVKEGVLKTNQGVTVIGNDGVRRAAKASRVFTFHGLQRVEADQVGAGDVVAVAGIEDIYVGETIALDPKADPLPAIAVDPPTLAMNIMVNTSPFAGREGKFLTSRHLRARLEKELESNVGLQVDFTIGPDVFRVSGRGEMHLAVLLENMRREGYEMQVSQPQVILQQIDGQTHEPIEHAVITLPEDMAGRIIELLGVRKGTMTNMLTSQGRTTLEVEIPTRGLLGLRQKFLILTKGEGVLYHTFHHMGPHRGPIQRRQEGSLISGVSGPAIAFALGNLQERGVLFISPGTEVYEGMIVGENNQGNDLVVNPLKAKKLTNMRASGSDDAIKLTPPVEMTLENALQYIQEDEYVEVTPGSIRLRKQLLSEHDRKRQVKKAGA